MPSHNKVGVIVAIRDYGTIVQVTLRNGRSVYFDRRQYGYMAEAESGHIIGRRVRITGPLGDERIEFLS